VETDRNMPLTYRHTLLLGLCAAMALGAVSSPLGAAGARADAALLKKIASRLDGTTGVVAIEASAPVPYVASQPDERTFVIELRDVVASGFEDDFTADPRHPVAAVQVESAHAVDGVAVARVRMTLGRAMRPRVRSVRNVIYVEADRIDGSAAAERISLSGPSTAIRDLRVTKRGGATAVTLRGTSRLVATSVQEPKDGQRRLVLDFPNVTSALAPATPVNQGPVERVRVGFSPKSPLITQVSMDLTRAATYRLETSADGNDLTVVFDEPVADPIAALKAGTLTASPAAADPAPAPPAVDTIGVDLPVRPAQQMAAVQTNGPGRGPLLDSPRPAVVAESPRPAARAQAAPAAPAAAPVPAGPAPAPQAAAPQPPVQTTTVAPPRYSGHPVSLDFQGSDLRAVLRVFAEISGLNIVIDPTIQGTVDVALRDVPWDQALDIILRANKLGYVVDGTIVRIAPLTVLADEEAQRRKLSEEQALAGELQVLTRSLSYARADDLRPLLTTTVLSQRGTIQTDQRTNTIIINDLPDRLQRASELLTTLDRPEPQVEIEARIVQTTRDFARRLGVAWGVNARASAALGNGLPVAFPNQASVTGRTGANQGAPPPDPGSDLVSNMVNLGVQGAPSAVGLALGSINGAINLDVALSAVEESGQGKILSTPRVATQNNVAAEITQGVQIPIQTVANNTVTVTFRDAALTLKVTPQITAANTVIMNINLENASPDFSRSVNNIPPIDTQRAVTQVLVEDGETTVIGGIFISREQASQDRTPALHRIPLLGWLFKRDEFAEESRELLIFITPRILRL
jgi:type IV pilus assembly protein PilQ